MRLDSEYFKRILQVAVEHEEAKAKIPVFSEAEVVKFDEFCSVDKFVYHISLLKDHGFVELPHTAIQGSVFGIIREHDEGYYYISTDGLRVTALGQDFYAQITDATIWQKVKPVIGAYGVPVAVELAKSAALKAVGL